MIFFSFIALLFILNSSQNFLYPLIGALLGFSKLNWGSSKIFMGDAGSLFLGSFIVSILFNCDNSTDSIKILLVMKFQNFMVKKVSQKIH